MFFREKLIHTLTSIIFTGSVQHQALNAPQFTYAYQPHRPVKLKRWMPDDNVPITWKWIQAALASDEIAKVKLLSFVTSLTLRSYV